MATETTERRLPARATAHREVAAGRRLWWWAVPGALAGGLLSLAAHQGLIDDSYITLAFARNLAEHLHWGLIPTEESNAATSPLNVVLLALAARAAGLGTGDVRPVLGLGLLTVLLTAALAVWAAQTARRLGVSTAWNAAVLAVVLANPFVNSSLGLEVAPISALLMGLAAQAVAGRRAAFGVLAGLLVLTRLDLVVVVGVVYLLTPALRRRAWVAPTVAALLALPWFVFSWWHLGSAIPSTFVIKTLQGSFGEQTFANGLWTLWVTRGGVALALAVVPAVVGVLTAATLLARAVRGRLRPHVWPVAALGLGGLAHFGAYAVLGVPPYQWYYVPATVSLGITGVYGTALAFARRSSRPSGRVAAVVPAVLVTAALAVGSSISLDGRALPWDRPVYFGNWALPQEYLDIGAAVAAEVGDATVKAPPEIGTLAYACRCSILDAFSDPGRTAPLVQRAIREAGPVLRPLLELNAARLDLGARPRPAEYRLVWTQGPVPAGVPAWPVHSPATGPAVLYLQPLS